MTEEEFLERCKIIYKKGWFADRTHSSLLCEWLDFVLRLEHTLFAHGQTQGDMVWQFLASERERIRAGTSSPMTLANDKDGYGLIQMAAIFDHPCQECASDPNAWHTRYAFCSHNLFGE